MAIFRAEVETTVIGTVFTVFLGMFAHLNTSTPRWLGYFVQRPEAHAAHHERGVHAYNFGFPIWDMLFGTFRNPPKGWQGTNGFWDGASNRVVPMLLGRDVSRMPEMPATALAGFVPSRLEVEPAANVMTIE
jgi:sterol desaturase/sphingolipid hydroxylase (fatty acid hydroxylase superfamily)